MTPLVRGEFKGLRLHFKTVLAFPFLGYVSVLGHSLSLLPMTGSVKGFVIFYEKEDVYVLKQESHCESHILACFGFLK